MSQWHLRPIANRSRSSACSAESLRDMLRSGVLCDQHEYRAPDEERWIGARDAARRLEADHPTADAPVEETEIDDYDDFETVHEDGNLDLDEFDADDVDDSDVGSGEDVDVVEVVELPTRRGTKREAPSPSAAAQVASVPDIRASRFLLSDMEDEEDELDMTPMIDMTFLLLIFFMVTSSVSRSVNLELPASMTGRAEETQTRIVLVADFPGALSGEDSKSFVGAKFITLADAKLYFEEDAERVFAATEIESELQRAFATKPNCQFILQANRKMPVGVVRQLLKAATQAGAKETLVGVTMPR